MVKATCKLTSEQIQKKKQNKKRQSKERYGSVLRIGYLDGEEGELLSACACVTI